MGKIPVYYKCWRCKGTGVAIIDTVNGQIEEDPCIVCSGSGYYENAYIDDSLQTAYSNIMDKFDLIQTGYGNIIAKLDQILQLLQQ